MFDGDRIVFDFVMEYCSKFVDIIPGWALFIWMLLSIIWLFKVFLDRDDRAIGGVKALEARVAVLEKHCKITSS